MRMMNLFLDTKCQLMKITRLLALIQKFRDINSKIKLSDTLFLKSTNEKSLPDCR